jgi:hypothetical protein
LLEAHGHVADPVTVERLEKALFTTKRGRHGDEAPRGRRLVARSNPRYVSADGCPDGRPEGRAAHGPERATTAQQEPLKSQHKGAPRPSSLIAAWAAESGTTGNALYDHERTGRMVSTFLGHDDPTRVTADDVVL